MSYGDKTLFGKPCMVNAMDRVFVIVLAYTIITCFTTPVEWNGPTSISERPTLTDPEFKYPVTVEWGRGADTMAYWDQLCVYAIEQFGLPGARYITEITADYMAWQFRSDQDALLFRLRFSEVVT